ncbi:MAG: HAD-IA family hydrolase [Bacilli bacterium]
MIKNLILDNGNVLVKWDPNEIANLTFPEDKETAKIYKEKVLEAKNWYFIDSGKYTIEEVAKIFANQVDEKYREKILYAIRNFNKIIPILYKENEWVNEAKNKSFNIYILSNTNEKFVDMLKRFPCKDSISGYLTSYDSKLMKPDINIYKLLCKKYNLKPEECMFIDDIKINVDASLQAGYGKGLVYDGNITKLYDILK